jgi:lauroyl/myristoyl acyltransferase
MADAASQKKKKKKPNPVMDYLSFVSLRVLVVFLSLFDIETNLNTACLLGRLLWRYYHRGRKRALDNLRASFPGESQEWIERTGRRSFEHIVMLAVDILFTPRLARKHNWRCYSRYKSAHKGQTHHNSHSNSKASIDLSSSWYHFSPFRNKMYGKRITDT